MLALRFILMLAGVLLLATAVGIPLYGLWLRVRVLLKRSKGEQGMLGPKLVEPAPEPIEWRLPVALALVACLPMVIASSIVVVPSGMGGVRVSQIAGTLPGTLYPGVHFVTPLVQSVKMFDCATISLRPALWTKAAKTPSRKTRSMCSRARASTSRSL
jgi:hypothetical protein